MSNPSERSPGHAPAAVTSDDQRAMRWVLPIGRSWVAIVAGYVGLFGLCIIPAPLALVLGIAAIVHIKMHPGKGGMGRAIFALVVGVVGTVVLAVAVLSNGPSR